MPKQRPLLPLLGTIALALSLAQTAVAQTPAITVMSYCWKVDAGKAADFEAFIKDTGARLARVSIDAGELETWTIARAAIPSGDDAPCDFVTTVTFMGMPPDQSAERASQMLAKAGVKMTYEQYTAKTRSFRRLRTSAFGFGVARIGDLSAGDYVRVNNMKVQPGKAADWMDHVRKVTTPIQTERIKAGALKGWRVAVISVPGGSGQPVNAYSLDIYPSFEAAARGLWDSKSWAEAIAKVSPQMTFQEWSSRTADLRDIVSMSMMRVVAHLKAPPQK